MQEVSLITIKAGKSVFSWQSFCKLLPNMRLKDHPASIYVLLTSKADHCQKKCQFTRRTGKNQTKTGKKRANRKKIRKH